MDELARTELVQMGWKIHGAVEDGYLQKTASKGDADSTQWLEKQRLLLADMAIHLMQTALQPGPIELDKLRNSLHAILTISDQFLPRAGLKKATEHIYHDGDPVPSSGQAVPVDLADCRE